MRFRRITHTPPPHLMPRRHAELTILYIFSTIFFCLQTIHTCFNRPLNYYTITYPLLATFFELLLLKLFIVQLLNFPVFRFSPTFLVSLFSDFPFFPLSTITIDVRLLRFFADDDSNGQRFDAGRHSVLHIFTR